MQLKLIIVQNGSYFIRLLEEQTTRTQLHGLA